MSSLVLVEIIDFIINEIKGYDINFDYKIENDVLITKFSGYFTNNNDIEMHFTYKNNKVQIYHLGESYIEVDTRSFWIDFMSRIDR